MLFNLILSNQQKKILRMTRYSFRYLASYHLFYLQFYFQEDALFPYGVVDLKSLSFLVNDIHLVLHLLISLVLKEGLCSLHIVHRSLEYFVGHQV